MVYGLGLALNISTNLGSTEVAVESCAKSFTLDTSRKIRSKIVDEIRDIKIFYSEAN